MPGDATDYPDIDMLSEAAAGGRRFIRRDGTPY